MSKAQKLWLYFAIVLLTAIGIGIANWYVFPHAFWLATIMLTITVIVAGVFTWHGENATPKVKRYCATAHIVLAVVLAANVCMHFLLSREVSAIEDSTVARHVEEDRDAQRRKDESAQRVAEMKAAAELNEEDRKRMIELPTRKRESSVKAGLLDKLGASGDGEKKSEIGAGAITSRLTVEDVRQKWWWWMTAIAILECFSAVVLGAWLIRVWEWDRDGDGVDDAKQRSEKQRWADEQERRYEQVIASGGEWKIAPAEVTVLDDGRESRVATQERVHFDANENPTKKTTRVATQSAADTLRDHLHVIAEAHPGFHFKADEKKDGVWIRLYSKDRGRDVKEYQRKYPLSILDSVDEPGFRDQLEAALPRHGFKFEKGQKGRE